MSTRISEVSSGRGVHDGFSSPITAANHQVKSELYKTSTNSAQNQHQFVLVRACHAWQRWFTVGARAGCESKAKARLEALR